jgi:C-terminal processing protease CtpA/Prc
MLLSQSARLVILLLSACFLGQAQLTTDQRLADFRNLADTYAKGYAFYEWKRDAVKFDAFNLQPWIARVRAVQSDLDFYDLMVEYVASLNDAHDAYFLPSTFAATMAFTADIYDGKALIDSIDRTRLPVAEFPFEIGDELVSIDGTAADKLLDSFLKYATAANPRSTRREAARTLTRRFQDLMPRAHEIGDTAAVVVMRQSGETATYNIPWRKSGTPVVSLPGAPVIRTAAAPAVFGEYPRILPRIQNWRIPKEPWITGFGAKNPVFELPEGFQVRSANRDPLYSGVFTIQGMKVGYVRIPQFPSFSFSMTDQVRRDVAFFNDNTEGLIVDVTRNPGGSPCGAEDLLSYLIPAPFKVIRQEIRINWLDVLSYMEDLADARLFGTDEEIAQLELLLGAAQRALNENRPRTEPVPICGASEERKPAEDRTGINLAYKKPVMLLVDDFSASAAEVFAATFQDNNRGKVFGWRTMGAGGGVGSANAGTYTEGDVSITVTAGVRPSPVKTGDFPETPYWENVGVRPDVSFDYMTKDNLLGKGKAYVEAFSNAIAEQIRAGKP